MTPDQRRAKQVLFLAAFAEVGTITHAALAAGVDRQTHYNWLEADEAYAKAFVDAEGMAADTLEHEARRRACDGVDEPVFYEGKKVATVRKYSDTLLIFLLKGARPEKFRDRHELSGPGGKPLPAGQVHVYLPSNGREG